MTDNGRRRRVRSHGTSGYRAGCRCYTCVSAETDRKRNYRATGSGAKSSDYTEGAAGDRNSEVGEVEAAVIAECESLPLAAQRPTLVIAARDMARIMDNREVSHWHSKAAKAMLEYMAQLYPQQKPRKMGQRLATVHALTKVKR
jgi:hypothetical protein